MTINFYDIADSNSHLSICAKQVKILTRDARLCLYIRQRAVLKQYLLMTC